MIKPWNEIIVGSKWRPNDGGAWRVVIVSVTEDEVVYRDFIDHSKTWNRDPFHFQVRYREDLADQEEAEKFRIDYERVQKVVAKTNFLLADNDSLIRNIIILMNEMRTEAAREAQEEMDPDV